MALCLPCEAVAITGDLMAARWASMGRGPVRSCQDPLCSGVWVGPEDPAPDAPFVPVVLAEKAAGGRPHSATARQRNFGIGILTRG